MTFAELTVVTAAAVLQLLTVLLWLTARDEARFFQNRYDAALRELELYRQWAVLRSPKTGRYLKRSN